MKTIIVLTTIFLILSCSYPTYEKLNDKEKLEFTPSKIDLLNHKIQKNDVYSLDADELTEIIKNSDKKYKLLFFNQIWCKTNLNALNCLLDKNLEEFDILILSGLDWIYTKSYRHYIDTTDYGLNVYILNLNKYPTQKALSIGQSTLKKEQIFLSEFFGKKVYKELSELEYLPSFYILDSEKEILYTSSEIGCMNPDCTPLINRILSEFNDVIKKSD